MKNIFVLVLSDSIENATFAPFWNTFVHTCLAHHYKVHCHVQMNADEVKPLGPISQVHFGLAEKLNESAFDQSLFYKAVSNLTAKLKAETQVGDRSQLWLISDSVDFDESKVNSAVEALESSSRVVETLYFHLGAKCEHIADVVSDYFAATAQHCFEALSKFCERAARRFAQTELWFDHRVNVEIELFRGPKADPSLYSIVKTVKIDSTNKQPVKRMTKLETEDGLEIDPKKLETFIEIGGQTKLIAREDKIFYTKKFRGTQSAVKILGFCSLDDNRIPSVSVSDSAVFMFGPKQSQLFHGLLKNCIKKRKGFFVQLRLDTKPQVLSLCFALPNKDLNCFELVAIPCDGQRRNGEERPAEGAPASTERQNLLAAEYVESLPNLNPDDISHPLMNHYHSKLSQLVKKPGLFIPVDPCRESSASEHAGNLILSHGIWNEDNLSSDSVESDLSIYNKVKSGKNLLVKVLKEYCVRNKLPATGKKADLIATIAASSPPKS